MVLDGLKELRLEKDPFRFDPANMFKMQQISKLNH